jgi:hypothetical protein
MNTHTTADPKSTLKENFIRSKQPTMTPTPTAPTPAYTPSQDPLYRWLQHDVRVVFMSGREVSGKLTILARYALGVVDADGLHQIGKHAIEQVHLAVRP